MQKNDLTMTTITTVVHHIKKWNISTTKDNQIDFLKYHKFLFI